MRDWPRVLYRPFLLLSSLLCNLLLLLLVHVLLVGCDCSTAALCPW